MFRATKSELKLSIFLEQLRNKHKMELKEFDRRSDSPILEEIPWPDHIRTDLSPVIVSKAKAEEWKNMSTVHVTIPSVEVNQNAPKPFVVYNILVKIHSLSWIVKKRYSDFERLHQELQKELPRNRLISSEILALPPKKLLGNLDPGFIEERRKQLSDYLVDICNESHLFESQTFGTFINIDLLTTLVCEQEVKDQQINNLKNFEN